MLTLFTQDKLRSATLAAALAGIAMIGAPDEAAADAYIGGSVGQVGIEIEDASFPGASFDEDDFGWKVFLGYEFDLPLLSLGLEGGYVDFGAPSGTVDVLVPTDIEVDADGLSAFGTIGIDLGPLGIFAKYGVISWDASLSVDGLDAGSEDGSDPAYGIGAKIGIGSIDVRAEYEIFDIEDAEDLTMLSLGLVWTFD